MSLSLEVCMLELKKNMLYAMLTSTDFFFTEEEGKKC